MWSSQTNSQDYDFSLSFQHQLTTSTSTNLVDRGSRRGRGRGSRGAYKPRNRFKQDDKYSSNNKITKKDEHSGVYINPKILIQLGYLTYQNELSKHTETPLITSNNNNIEQIKISKETIQPNINITDSHHQPKMKILSGAEALLELDNNQDCLFNNKESDDNDDNFTLTAYYSTS